MLDLPETVIDEIFDRAFKLQQRLHAPDYIKFLLRFSKLASIFDLYEHSKVKAVSSYHEIVKSYLIQSGPDNAFNTNSQSIRHSVNFKKVKPILTWRL